MTEQQEIDMEETIRKYFKEEHPNDNKLKKHCVDCGNILIEYKHGWDGERLVRGNRISSSVKSFSFIGGLRCMDCDEKIYAFFGKIMEKYDRRQR